MADDNHLTRRAFVRSGTLLMLGAAGSTVSAEINAADKPAVRLGIVTDLHYADKKPVGSRYYRESLAKLAEAAELFSKKKPQLVVELGDLVDAADSVAVEKGYLKRIHKDFSAIPGQKHYVLGNHCVHTLTKKEFLDGVGQKNSHYSFDAGSFHFVVLDSCFRKDGQPYQRNNFHWTDPNIPAAQVDWLKADLKGTTKKTIILAHQRLDVKTNYAVKNAKQIRRVLEESNKVLAVLQGHSHKNDYQEIAGIHYCTLAAMVEGSGEKNNGYAIMDIAADGTIRIDGFRKQKDYRWA